VVIVYKVAAIHKRGGDGISIYSYTNCLDIKAVRKVFKGEVVVKQVLDY
jgi:hypothetical protein